MLTASKPYLSHILINLWFPLFAGASEREFGLWPVLMTQPQPHSIFPNTPHVMPASLSSENSRILNLTVNGIPPLLVLSYCQACIALSLGLFLNHILTSSALSMTLVLVHMLQTYGSPTLILLSNLIICKILVLYFTMFTNATSVLLLGYSRMMYLEHFVVAWFTLLAD